MSKEEGIITRITGGDFLTEIEGSWTVFTETFEASAGKFSKFSADEVTNFGTPETDDNEDYKYFDEGWWSSDEAGNNRIKEAEVGQEVFFHIKMKNVTEKNANVNIQLYDHDGALNLDDKITIVESGTNKVVSSKPINNNKALVRLTLSDGLVSFIEDDYGDEIELYFECSYKNESPDLPAKPENYLKVYEKTETITVLIELPHSSYTDKLNRKGLGGHTAIIIGEEYYDFGPQPGEPFNSEGRPWWDKMSQSGNLTKNDILIILNDNQMREDWNIVGRVCLIEIDLRKSEMEKVEKWWVNRYNNLGTYSVIPFIGEQCTSTVRISIEENTNVFDLFPENDLVNINTITSTTQSPQGFLDLLLSSGRHTNGKKKGKLLNITKEYNEL